MAIGTLLGGIIGGVAGSVIPGLGPKGAAMGSQLGAGIGTVIEGGVDSKKAQEKLPPSEDPAMRQYLGELDKRRKQFGTGSIYGNKMRQLGNIQSGTQAALATATGGNVGAAVEGMGRAAESIGSAYGGIVENEEVRLGEVEGMYAGLLNTMAQRRAELGMLQYGQKLQTAAEKRKQGMQTLLNIAPSLWGGGEKVDYNTPAKK